MGKINVSQSQFEPLIGLAEQKNGTKPLKPGAVLGPTTPQHTTPNISVDALAFRALTGHNNLAVMAFLGPEKPPEIEAKALLAQASSPGLWGASLDSKALGKTLAQTLQKSPPAIALVAEVLKLADDQELVRSLITQIPEQTLNALAQDKPGQALLYIMYSDLNDLYISAQDHCLMQKIVGAVSPRYGPLASFEFKPSQEFQAALDTNNSKLQKLSEATHLAGTRYDHYQASVSLPNPQKAEDLYKIFAANLNTVGNNTFDMMENFSLRGGDGITTQPKVGDIYDINIMGPDNGSVMVGESELSADGGHFTIVTIAEPAGQGNGVHPENGVREFGYTNHHDGSYTFYTTGASRGLNVMIHAAGAIPQELSAKGLIQGFIDQSISMGGSVVQPLSAEMQDPVLKLFEGQDPYACL